MKQLALTPTHVTFNSLLHATGRSFRYYSRAYEVFEEMNAAGYAHDVYSYNSVLLACSHKGEVARAREYMRQMTVEGVRPDQITFNTLITVYARALGQVESLLVCCCEGRTVCHAACVLQLKKNPGGLLTVAEQTAKLSDGKGLLDPKKPFQQQEFGSGVVYVDGDEDVSDRVSTGVGNYVRMGDHSCRPWLTTCSEITNTAWVARRCHRIRRSSCPRTSRLETLCRRAWTCLTR
jgi:pentatricopeptide repeat protein